MQKMRNAERGIFARFFVLVLVVVLEDESTNDEKTEPSRVNFAILL
jgi:hypothetical protein